MGCGSSRLKPGNLHGGLSSRRPDATPVDTNGGAEIPFEAIEAKRVSYDEMKRATNRFNKSNFIGQGPTGEVYRGNLGGREIAVKKLSSNSQTEDDFLEEVELVKQFKNKHVVQLVAYCPEAGHRTLAFEYAPLGSLYDLLHGKGDVASQRVLTWQQRLKIIQGAAMGLDYLHSGLGASGGDGLVHKRIKSNNVLVFPGFLGKVADCKLQPQDQDSILLDSSLPLGNFACEAPESFSGELTQKSDVYSFGIVLLEILSGRKSMQGVGSGGGAPSRQQQSIKEWAFAHIATHPNNLRPIVDPKMKPEELSDKGLQRFCKLASICLDTDPGRRPDMKIVLKTLQRLD